MVDKTPYIRQLFDRMCEQYTERNEIPQEEEMNNIEAQKYCDTYGLLLSFFPDYGKKFKVGWRVCGTSRVGLLQVVEGFSSKAAAVEAYRKEFDHGDVDRQFRLLKARIETLECNCVENLKCIQKLEHPKGDALRPGDTVSFHQVGKEFTISEIIEMNRKLKSENEELKDKKKPDSVVTFYDHDEKMPLFNEAQAQETIDNFIRDNRKLRSENAKLKSKLKQIGETISKEHLVKEAICTIISNILDEEG